jgi:hypothetical protein
MPPPANRREMRNSAPLFATPDADHTIRRKSPVNCGFSALVKPRHPFYFGLSKSVTLGASMKKIAVGTAVILAILSLAACAQVGKGKAPPPVVTKG